MSEKGVADVNDQVKQLLAAVIKMDSDLEVRMAKGRAVIEKEQDSHKKRDYQTFYNFLRVWKTRVSTCRDILDQSVVLIIQEGEDLLVAKRIDDPKIRQLVKIAEEHGGVVVGVESLDHQREFVL